MPVLDQVWEISGTGRQREMFPRYQRNTRLIIPGLREYSRLGPALIHRQVRQHRVSVPSQVQASH